MRAAWQEFELNSQPWLEVVADDLQKVELLIEKVTAVDYQPVASFLRHTLLAKGKRLRPALVLLSAKFHNYRPEVLVTTAASIELLHTATLVHDDIIDDALSRRGSPTLNTMTSGRAAVLVGDYIFAQSAILAVDAENIRAMRAFAATLAVICDGELREVLNAGKVTEPRAEYYHRIRAKTASLFAAATHAGGILSDAPQDVCEALREYGHCLGMAFQIVDDVLDFVGDARQMGKPVGNDLRQGTLTLPAIYLMEEFPENNAVAELFALADRPEAMVSKAVEAVVTSAAVDRTYEEARNYIHRAKNELSILPDNQYRKALEALADYVVGRRQ